MILQALYEMAQTEGLSQDLDFQPKPITYLIFVDDEGRLLNLVSTKTAPPAAPGKRAGKAIAKSFPVPREPTRTSGARAFFFYDKAEYVFGIDPEGKRAAAQLAERASLFRDKVSACAESTGDAAARAVLQLLDNLADGSQAVSLPEDCAGNDLFAFIYQGEAERLVTQRPAIEAHWRQLRTKDQADEQIRCLVTGTLSAPAKKHTSLKNVPGGSTSGVALVSFNNSAFESYGWKGNDNAPVSQEAAETYGVALNRLLHPAYPDPKEPGSTLARRNRRLADDTVLCYWADAGDQGFADAFGDVLDANPEGVAEVYHSIWSGKPPTPLGDEVQFYGLILAGAQGRASVRDWIETTVNQAQKNVARHFADLKMVRVTPPPKKGQLPPALGIRSLLSALAPKGREGVPGPLAAQLAVAALQGTPFPLSLLQRALIRTRAEIGDDDWVAFTRRDARAAIIKAVLNRQRRAKNSSLDQEITPAMDPNNHQPGYLLGRLMAVLENLQAAALGDVNASVVDRYFGAASATPQAVFTRLLKGARHHVRKLRDEADKGGLAVWLDRQIDTLVASFDPKQNGFPAHLDLEQQGLFVLGYHQQRHWLRLPKAEREALEASASKAT
ncbi:MAG: type I-C CRISPR-associated protein Cas8c/Csd1 [Acidobacteriota bacterium]